MKVRTRFAPSPTGSPHIGNIRTAVFDYLFARHSGGDFILRVEDTDRNRYVENSLSDMMIGLKWMGMDWNEGPEVSGDFGPYFQSQRLDIYNKYAEQLLREGKAYYCFCTKERLSQLREEQTAAKLSHGYDRCCRDLSLEEIEEKRKENPYPVIRFKMKRDGVTDFNDVVRGTVSFQNELEDDFVIIKADGFPTYHFASIVDDHHMQITHVIRGEEWISSAPKHIQLYDAFGWEPPIWVHPPLILDEKGKKLSKRSDTATAFMSYIEEGYLPEAMLNFLATMGWSSGEDKKIFTKDELIEKFSLEGIVNHPAIFDILKLRDINGEYIRMKSIEELAETLLPYMQKVGFVSSDYNDDEKSYLLEVTKLIQDRIVTLAEAPYLASFFYEDVKEYEEKGLKHFRKENFKDIANNIKNNLIGISNWTLENIEVAVRGVADDMSIKPAEVIHPTRMAVTGRTWGPGLFELMFVIGQDSCVRRFQQAIDLKVN